MRLSSPALKVLAVATLPLALAACSSGSGTSSSDSAPSAKSAAPKSPAAELPTGTELKKALAPASYFPSGFAVDAGFSRDTGDDFQPQTTKSAAKPRCADLGATGWIGLTGIDGVSFAQNSYVNDARTTELDQEIDAYRDSAAADVMKGLAKVVTACPGYPDSDVGGKVKVTGAPTGGLGDEAYTITLTNPAWENGTTLVAARVGTAVVSVLSTEGDDNGAASGKKLTAHIVASLEKQGTQQG
ncbi:hypothetical protein ACF08B_07125 [Streptomyces sp. NPDC015139]|uniref:hypothetical protein n=1 Tax=Streptomyces sp. NPDC015139 TaxID=3364942 RepID=UPI0036FEED76